MTARRTVIIIEDHVVIEALADYFVESRAASWRGAWSIVLERLSAIYGERLVTAAERRYARELRREQRSLQRQVRQARAAYLKRQRGV